jgi:pyruvate formate lyase activating enzyme
LTGVAYIKTSLIDFPGRLASVLFLPGCDFRCPYCHNAALVDPAAIGAEGASPGSSGGLAPMGEFLEFLDKRKSLISGVVISGGEPLVHEEAPRIARAIRERGLAVKLDTNGSFPSRIAEVGADYVALDFKTAPSAYGRVAPALADAGERVLESIAYLRSSGTPFEIRITCAPGIAGAQEIEEMANALELEDEVLLQDFRPGGCLDPGWDDVAPYPREAMERLLAIVSRRAPFARMRESRNEGRMSS